MITVTKTFKFCYAHRLKEYNGKCSSVHGHNAKVQVEVVGPIGNETPGILFDFSRLKSIWKENIDPKLDHKYLNDIEEFNEHPTAEKMAIWIRDEFIKYLPEEIQIAKIRVWETDDSFATYYSTANLNEQLRDHT